MTYEAFRCPCGHPVCEKWMITGVTDGRFTEAQARFIAAALNLGETNPSIFDKPPVDRSWRPIKTAPRSGFGRLRQHVLVRGPSGQNGVERFVVLAYHDAEYRPHDPWRMIDGDALSDLGWKPTEWTEVPR